MKIEIDEIEKKPLVGERRGIVSNENGSYAIPAPLLTNTDINAAANLSEKKLIDTHYKEKRVFEIRENIFKKRIDETYTDSPENEEQISWINGQIAKAKLSSDIVESLYTPNFINIEPNEIQIKRIVRTQIRTNLSIIAIPDGAFIKSEIMRNIVKDLIREIESAGKKPFYRLSIDMNHANFTDKLEAIKPLVDGVVVVNNNIESHLDNLNELIKLRNDSNLIRILSNADRTCPSDSISAFYPLCFLFSDLYSVKYGLPFGKKDIEKELTNAKRLDTLSLGYLTIQKHKEFQGNSLNCECSVCYGYEINDIKIEFLGYFTNAFRVHEAVTVFNLAQNASGLFHNSQLLPFLREKRNISPLIKDYIGAKLDDYI